jgi:hypothetical protein
MNDLEKVEYIKNTFPQNKTKKSLKRQGNEKITELVQLLPQTFFSTLEKSKCGGYINLPNNLFKPFYSSGKNSVTLVLSICKLRTPPELYARIQAFVDGINPYLDFTKEELQFKTEGAIWIKKMICFNNSKTKKFIEYNNYKHFIDNFKTFL